MCVCMCERDHNPAKMSHHSMIFIRVILWSMHSCCMSFFYPSKYNEDNEILINLSLLPKPKHQYHLGLLLQLDPNRFMGCVVFIQLFCMFLYFLYMTIMLFYLGSV